MDAKDKLIRSGSGLGDGKCSSGPAALAWKVQHWLQDCCHESRVMKSRTGYGFCRRNSNISQQVGLLQMSVANPEIDRLTNIRHGKNLSSTVEQMLADQSKLPMPMEVDMPSWNLYCRDPYHSLHGISIAGIPIMPSMEILQQGFLLFPSWNSYSSDPYHSIHGIHIGIPIIPLMESLQKGSLINQIILP